MSQKVFTGNGLSAGQATENANNLCDQWIRDETAAGRRPTVDSRTSNVAKDTQTRWVAQTTLNYH